MKAIVYMLQIHVPYLLGLVAESGIESNGMPVVLWLKQKDCALDNVIHTSLKAHGK